MENLLIYVVIALLYLASAFLIADRTFRREKALVHNRKPALAMSWLALILHITMAIKANIGIEGINVSLISVISFITITTVLLLLVSAFSKPIESIGIVVFSLAAITSILSITDNSRNIIEAVDSGLRLHIILSIMSYSIIGLAAVQACVLWVQNQSLKQHHPGGFIRSLPPLQTMEEFLFELIIGGFVLLSTSLLTGFIYLNDIFAQHLVHKTVLSMISWALLAVLLWGRFSHGWRGKKAIQWTLGSFGFLMLSYFGSRFVLEILLHR